MKNITIVLFALMSFVACESVEDVEDVSEWNRVTGLIAQYGDFDPAVVEGMLTTGVVESTAYFKLDDKSLVNGGSTPWPGSQPIRFLFFEDGACWACWTDTAQMYDGGWFYREYHWSYDAQTRALVTWHDYIESRASVKAVVGNDTLILEGDLGDHDGLRMVLQIDTDPDLRADYLKKYRNIADYK